MSQEEYKFSENAKELLHTPGGVRDIYGIECARRLRLEEQLHVALRSYGFRDIKTPTFEYFDVFSRERGTVQSSNLFKFFDRGNNTLVLRPDITPSIARCVAKYYREEKEQIRFCYTGSTFVNTPPYKGKLQEVTQLGAELVNDDSSDADAEMVALTIECLLQSGLKEFQLEVGHAGFLQGLIEEAGLEPQEITRLHELIESKNFFGVEELLDSVTISRELKEVFLALPHLLEDFAGNMDFVQKRAKSAKVHKALDRLQKLEEIIRLYGFEQYITIDLSMLSNYSYYTGIIFRAYTYGNGEALASGGRYDGLVGQFGKEASAIGMGIVLDQLMLALERQGLFEQEKLGGILLLYPRQLRQKALQEAARLRKEGKVVQMLRKSSRAGLDQYQEYAKRIEAEQLLYVTQQDIQEL